MERRSYGLGCIIVGLGSLLGLCLLPHLVSAIYSVFAVLFDLQTASKWLWGDWLSTVVENERWYMLLAEGPICCVGVAALIIIILGVVVWSGEASSDEDESEDEPDGFHDDSDYELDGEYADDSEYYVDEVY
jgi:hypothetical protein